MFLSACAPAGLCTASESVSDPGPGSAPPTIAAVRVESSPRIDGALDDPCWQEATRCCGFHLYGREAPVPEETTAYLCYDSQNIYVAFDCADSQVERIHAIQQRRGSDLSAEDHVQFWVDVAGQSRDWYIFGVSPLGTQEHIVPGGSASKVEWKGDWLAAARITERGWQAEMAIPFSILTYPAGCDTFLVAFSRYLARERERMVWPHVSPGSWRPDRPAQWRGLLTPRARRPMVTMPYVLARLGAGDGAWDAGVDVKQTLPNGVTVLTALRPDFRSVEQDVESIDFSYTERWLPDRRPFFSEGSYRYFPSSELFYTRRIEEVDLGVKAFGKVGAHRFGLLAAGAAGQSDIGVAQYAYEPHRDFSAWLSAVNCTLQDHRHNLAGGIGMRRRWPKPDGDAGLRLDLLRSATRGAGGEGSAYAVSAERERGDGGVNYWLFARGVSAGFDAALGYVPETGLNEFGAGLSYARRIGGGPYWQKAWSAVFESGSTALDSRYRVSFGGALYRRNNTWTEARISLGQREGYPDRTITLNYAWHDQHLYRYGGFTLSLGEKAGGRYAYLGLTKNFRPSDYFSARLSLEALDHAAAQEPASEHQVVAQATYDFRPDKSLSARLVAHNGAINLFAAYRRVVRAGLDTYVLLGDPNAETTRATLTAKLVSAFVF